MPCTPIALAQRIDASQYQTVKRPDGAVVLKDIRIEGETWAHTVPVAAN